MNIILFKIQTLGKSSLFFCCLEFQLKSSLRYDASERKCPLNTIYTDDNNKWSECGKCGKKPAPNDTMNYGVGRATTTTKKSKKKRKQCQ